VPQSLHYDLWLFSGQCLLDRDDELRKDWQDAIFAILDQRVESLISEELVGILGLTKPVKKDR
jgi:hypothetical protein